ncbi:MAG TPA: T9SS type A sorting domain-containing protein [Edaphocola sp.]|nr:T9SS type A sorting domain-containing protein [Edaphocola sp.]
MLLLGLNALDINAQGFCFMDSVQSGQQSLLKGATCTRVSSIYSNFFTKVNNYIPYPNQNTVTTTPKKIKVKVIVVTNSFYPPTTEYPAHFTINDTATITHFIQNLCNYADPSNGLNISLSSIGTPTNPQTAVCGSCHISDSKFQVELTGIKFVTTNENLQTTTKARDINYHISNFSDGDQDSILNIFMVNYKMNGYPIVDSNDSYGGLGQIGFHYSLRKANHGVILYKAKGDEWSKYQTLILEFGHNFGLWHTFDKTECPPYIPMEFFLDDVFGTNPSFCHFPNDKDTNCNPDLPANKYLCSNNLMGGKPNRIEFLSPKQLGRMHRNSYLGSVSQFIYPTEAPDVHPMEITSNQTWDFGIRMYQDIIVKAGKTLTITCEVQMPPGGKIIVEKGAKLVLDAGTITSYHPKASWKGIELYGDKNAQPIPTNQGRLEMKNNSLIEYAELGVQDFITNVWNGGGIINVYNSTFKDCRRAVALNDYPNYARGTSCSFFNVNFINEDANAITNQNLTGVGVFTSYNEKGVLIANSTFKNKLALNGTIPIENSNYAVYTNDAGFRITNSIFKGYKVGVTTMTVNNNPSRSTKILNCTFDSLFTGIMFADNFSMAQNNTFDHLLGYFDGIKDYAQFGQAIYAHNPNGLLINKNTINATYGNSIRGITVNDSRYFGSKVVDNTINNIYAGVITQRRNPQLDILCNHFTNGYYNIWGNPESNHPFFTLKDQGNGCGYFDYRAGNTFEGSATYHIYSNLYPTWNYFYFSNDISQIPTNTFGVSVNPDGCTNLTDATDPNSQCNLPSNTESWIDSLFDEAYTSWPENILGQTTISGQMQLAFIMQRLSERGSTDSIISFLENVNNLESQKLLLSLYLEQGNYTAFDNLLESISFSNGDETLAFKDYNNFLKTLSQENRTLFQLNLTEKELLETIATQDFEVSNYAKAMLEFVFMQEWEHYQERLPQESQMAKYENDTPKNQSSLGNATPNPNTGKVRINVNILEKDAQYATLNIYDLTGRLIISKSLQKGYQSLAFDLSQYNNGLYLYSLNINGKNKATKKLVLQK